MTKPKPFTPLPPSAWGQTPAQRLARLRRYVELSAGHTGRALEQVKRYQAEIEILTRNDEVAK